MITLITPKLPSPFDSSILPRLRGLIAWILIGTLLAAGLGVGSTGGSGKRVFVSVYGSEVTLYGHGLYRNDSVSAAAQAIAQDYVTLLIGVPLLFFAYWLACRGSIRAVFLLTGTLGYFLYTYASYTFLCTYNPLFLIYVLLFSASLFSFIAIIRGFRVALLPSLFQARLPVHLIGGFLLFLGIGVGLLWIGRILPPLFSHQPPDGLDHYSTLVIQALDLGIVVPSSLLAGIWIWKREPWGYLLSTVLIFKGVTLLTAIMAMMIGMKAAGEQVPAIELALFTLFTLGAATLMVIILHSIHERHSIGKV